jgi:hypothetical protein
MDPIRRKLLKTGAPDSIVPPRTSIRLGGSADVGRVFRPGSTKGDYGDSEPR